MLEFAGSYGEEGLELNFMDMVSPKEWKDEIDAKLKLYKEDAFVVTKNEKMNLVIILKLNPSDDEVDDIRYISRHINEFTDFYYTILNQIK